MANLKRRGQNWGGAAGIKKDAGRIMPYAAIAIMLVLLALISQALVRSPSAWEACGNANTQQSYSCLQQLAYSASNASVCARLPGQYASQCYFAVGEKTRNATICRMAYDSNDTAGCIAFVANATKDPRLCSSIGAGSVAGCVDPLAVASMNMSACGLIPEQSQRSLCLAAVGINSAVNGLNQSYCSRIQSNSNTSQTLAALDLVSLSNRLYSNFTQVFGYVAISNATFGARDMCYVSLAYATSNRSYCALVSGNVSGLCNFTAAHFKVSYNTTSATNYTAFLNLCYQQGGGSGCNSTAQYLKAVSARNMSDCTGLSSAYSWQCYYTLAQLYNNTKYCSYISNATFNNQCISAIRTGYNNIMNVS